VADLLPNYGGKICVKTVSDDCFVVSEGGDQAKVWKKVGDKFSIHNCLEYQDRVIKQLESGIKLKLSNSTTGDSTCVALLHEGGYISFWDHQSMEFVYSIKLRANDAKKIVFE
jgi:hypothetical protein